MLLFVLTCLGQSVGNAGSAQLLTDRQPTAQIQEEGIAPEDNDAEKLGLRKAAGGAVRPVSAAAAELLLRTTAAVVTLTVTTIAMVTTT